MPNNSLKKLKYKKFFNNMNNDGLIMLKIIVKFSIDL